MSSALRICRAMTSHLPDAIGDSAPQLYLLSLTELRGAAWCHPSRADGAARRTQ
jgi:hypothetical protein